MPRYAVLRDIHHPGVRPIGLVTEHADRVRVLLAEDRGVRADWHDPYNVFEPDGNALVYMPGEDGYFDHVLMSLSRTFVVDELDYVADLDDETVLTLYYSKVDHPRMMRGGRYVEVIAGNLVVSCHQSAGAYAPRRRDSEVRAHDPHAPLVAA
jgi:hypothetical protein